MIFVNSMSDLFHEKVPDDYIQSIFETMRKASWHQFQALTKRSERLLEISKRLPWPENVWMGVSVEDDTKYQRIIDLVKTDAKIQVSFFRASFVSFARLAIERD